MAIALVQHSSVNGGAVNSKALAFASDNTSGNLLVVSVRYGPSDQDLTITDSNGNVYQEAADYRGANNGVWMYYAKNCADGPNTVTVVGGGVATTMRFSIAEYSGADTDAPLDVTTTGSATGTSLSLPLATLSDGSLLAIAHGSSASSVASASGQYTLEEQQSNLFGYTDGLGVTAGAETGTVSLATSVTWIGVMAAFKPQAVSDVSDEWVPCEEPIGEFWDVPPYPLQTVPKGIAHLNFQSAGAPTHNRPWIQDWRSYVRYQGIQQPPPGRAPQSVTVPDAFIFSGPNLQNWRAYARDYPQPRIPAARVADLPAVGPVFVTGESTMIVRNVRRGRR